MDFQLLLIYSRVNCCTARGLAVGVGAEPRRPSGRPAVHVVQRLSWLLHLPGAGFRMLSRTCRASSTISQEEETKASFHPLPAPPGTWAACRSCAGPEERGPAPEAGFSARPRAWCSSHKDSMLSPHLFHLNHVSLLVSFVEREEHRDQWLPRSNAAGIFQYPKRSVG